MTALLQQLAQPLLDLVGSAALAACTYALAKLAAWFTAHTKNATLAGIEARLIAAAQSAVATIAQTASADLATGLSVANAKKLAADALALLKAQLGVKGLAELADIVGVGQLESVLQAKIEAAVAASKVTPPLPVTVVQNAATPAVTVTPKA
jgi:hypothetical protein